MIKDYNKLVRANIPKIIKANGEHPIYKVVEANSERGRNILLDKMIEEIEELRNAKTPEEMLAEFADVTQVHRDLMRHYGVNLTALERPRQQKELECGAFIHNGKMIYLEAVDIPDDKIKA